MAAVIAVIATAAGLTACGAPPPPAPAQAAAPAARPVPIDGTYDGLRTLVRGTAINCGNQDEFTLTIVNNTLTYQLSQPQVDWKPVILFTTAIGADGSFDAESGTSFMRGHIVNGHMRGELSGDVCGFTFEADRSGTW